MLPTFLPGRLTVVSGMVADYQALAHFHYAAGRPATFAAVWTMRWEESRISDCGLRIEDAQSAIRNSQAAISPSRPVAVAVLSYPTLNLAIRERVLGLSALTAAEKARFVNTHIRCISRVIVHPQFRALGLAVHLVRHILQACPTRYVEALAMMARASPFFDRAGMTRHEPADARQPVYYLHDCRSGLTERPDRGA